MATSEPTAAGSNLAADEAALVAELRAGSEAAFVRLVSDFGGRLLAVTRRLLANEEDARDAVQDAFLSAFKAIDRFDGQSQLATWLHRIALNAALMKLRTRRRKPEQSIEDLLPTFLDDGHQAHPSRWDRSAVAVLERAETQRQVREAIDQLPEAYRTVLLLRDIEQLDTQQTADFLQLSPGVVKTRLHRGTPGFADSAGPCGKRNWPMTCREVLDFLMDYDDGALPSLVRARFVFHLRLCAECRAYLKSYRATVAAARTACGGRGQTISDMPAPEVPPELVAAILRARKGE